MTKFISINSRPNHSWLNQPNEVFFISVELIEHRLRNQFCSGPQANPSTYSLTSDLCQNGTTSSMERGSIAWPTTQLGWRSIQICPYYSARIIAYAYRDCQLDGLNRTVWGEPQNYFCLKPPFSMRMDGVGNRTVSRIILYFYFFAIGNNHFLWSILHLSLKAK